MRRLLESLTPQARQIYWKWVGGIFALYVVLLLTELAEFADLKPGDLDTVVAQRNVVKSGAC